jgi:hypothetical protein
MTDLGVGDCPQRPEGFGHIWKSWRVDSRKSCEFCGRPGRDNSPLGGPLDSGGFFAEATGSRSMLIGVLNARRELTDEQRARAAAIVAEKKERDRVARESGVGRPGQLRGRS